MSTIRNSSWAAAVAWAASLAIGIVPCPGAEPDAATIGRLVRDLNAASRTIREAAEKALLEAGPAALPAIVAARGTAHGEAAFRLRGIQRALEDAAALETVDEGLATLALTVGRVEAVAAPPGAVRVVLRAAWQPPLDPVVVRLPLGSVVAEGPAGESMPVAQRRAVVEPAVVPGATAVELPVVLEQPDHPLDSLGLLRGTLQLWLAGRSHDFILPLDAAAQRAITVAKATVTLQEMAVRGGRLLVTARVAYDAPSEALASHRTWLAQCPLDVVGDDGRALARIDQTTATRSEEGLTTQATFALPATDADRLPPGLRMRWRLPMAIHEAPFDFAIRTVSLPASR